MRNLCQYLNIIHRIILVIIAIILQVGILSVIPSFSADNTILNGDINENEEIHVIADQLVSNIKEHYAEFSGDVKAKQGDLGITSDTLRIYYKTGKDNDKNTAEDKRSIEKIIASGNVKIKSGKQLASGDKAVYNVDSMILVLTGENCRISTEKSYIAGSKVTLNRADGKLIIEGDSKNRVSGVFYPEDKDSFRKKEAFSNAAKLNIPAHENKSDMVKQDNSTDILHKTNGRREKQGDIDKLAVNALTEAVQKETGAAGDQLISPATAPPLAAPDNIHISNELETKPAKITALEREFVPTKNLIKKIAIANFENNTDYNSLELNEKIRDDIYKIIQSKCSNSLVVKSGDDKNSENLAGISGRPVLKGEGKDLISMARLSGINMLITGSLISIRQISKTEGFLFFKSAKKTIEISFHGIINDTESGTRLVDKIYTYNIDIDKLGSDLTDNSILYKSPEFQDALSYFSGQMGTKAAEIINKQQWVSFVLSIERDRIKISSGKDAGLVPGNRLAVYKMERLNAFQGQSCYIIGDKIAEIRITAVNQDSSDAVLVSGQGISEDSLVKAVE